MEVFGLAADNESRHQIFVKVVLETRVVWGLSCEEGWAIAPSTQLEDTSVMPFWSHRGAAKAAAKEEWSHYEPTEIGLDRFLNTWLPGINGDGHLVGTNWNANMLGKEVEAYELALLLGATA